MAVVERLDGTVERRPLEAGFLAFLDRQLLSEPRLLDYLMLNGDENNGLSEYMTQAIRTRDDIPSACCDEVDDCCCSLFCLPCTLCQCAPPRACSSVCRARSASALHLARRMLPLWAPVSRQKRLPRRLWRHERVRWYDYSLCAPTGTEL